MECDEEELKATKEKSADEMFSELGYEKYNEYVYINYHTENGNEDKDIEFATVIEFYEKTFYKGHYGSIGDITMQELQAINKKCEELGWI